MKKLIGTLLIGTLAFTSCNNQEPKATNEQSTQEQTDPKQEFAKLHEFLRKFEEPSQTFKASTDKRIKLVGKHGTIFHINPSDLETESGQPIGKEVQVELKELTNQGQLLRANAQTVSDGQLLISGGACYINVTSDGQRVKLKNGKSYLAEFPQLSNEEMSLYYGQRDSSNKMNWKKAERNFEVRAPQHDTVMGYEAVISADGMRHPDTARIPLKKTTKEEIKKMENKMYEDTRLTEKVYKPIQLTQFGWINCDKLFPKAPRTQVQYTIANSNEEVNSVIVYLIFKDVKSVLQATYYSYKNNIQKENFNNNIPVGMTVRFLAVGYHNEKIFATLTDNAKVTENYNEKLSLKEINEGDFDKLMKSIE